MYVVGVIHSFQCQPLFSLALRWPTQIICPQMFNSYVLLINCFFPILFLYKYIDYVRICPWKNFVEIDSQRKICTLQEDVIKAEKLDLLLYWYYILRPLSFVKWTSPSKNIPHLNILHSWNLMYESQLKHHGISNQNHSYKSDNVCFSIYMKYQLFILILWYHSRRFPITY